jgi:hypothetical protein
MRLPAVEAHATGRGPLQTTRSRLHWTSQLSTQLRQDARTVGEPLAVSEVSHILPGHGRDSDCELFGVIRMRARRQEPVKYGSLPMSLPPGPRGVAIPYLRAGVARYFRHDKG